MLERIWRKRLQTDAGTMENRMVLVYVVSDSLWPHGLRHSRPRCPSASLRVYPNVCPLSRWCHSTISSPVGPFYSRLQSFLFFFFLLFFYFILVYNTVLVLPYINMSLPWVCTCSQSWTPSHLPPHTISLGHPSAPAPSILYPALNLGWRFVSYMILYMFQCHSPTSSHPLPLPQSPKDCSWSLPSV